MLAGVAHQQNAVVRMQAPDKLVHLFGGRKRTLVHHIKPVLSRIHALASGKMRLQGHGLDPGIGQRLRRAGRGREAFHLVPVPLRALADDGQRRRLARARDSIQTHDLLAGEKYLIDRLALPRIQLRVPVFGFETNSSRNQHGIAVAAPVAFLHVADGLALHAQHRRGRVLRARPSALDGAELARLHPALELLPHLGRRGLPHAAVERRFQNVAPVLDRRSLENMIAGIGHGPLRRLVGFVDVPLSLLLSMLPRLRYYLVGLMPVLCGQLPVPP
jgi:hypothetical protein